eukprot:1566231-Rhodomonas_salina.2
MAGGVCEADGGWRWWDGDLAALGVGQALSLHVSLLLLDDSLPRASVSSGQRSARREGSGEQTLAVWRKWMHTSIVCTHAPRHAETQRHTRTYVLER